MEIVAVAHKGMLTMFRNWRLNDDYKALNQAHNNKIPMVTGEDINMEVLAFEMACTCADRE